MDTDGTADRDEAPFWRRKSLREMTPQEWESLCDGCGRCCLIKLQDDDTGEVLYTDVSCRLLDPASCRCRRYPERRRHVPDCVALTPETVERLTWMPPTCAYRLLAEGRDLEWWHPLVSGDARTVRWAGISVADRVTPETAVDEDDLPERIVDWPLKGAR